MNTIHNLFVRENNWQLSAANDTFRSGGFVFYAGTCFQFTGQVIFDSNQCFSPVDFEIAKKFSRTINDDVADAYTKCVIVDSFAFSGVSRSAPASLLQITNITANLAARRSAELVSFEPRVLNFFSLIKISNNFATSPFCVKLSIVQFRYENSTGVKVVEIKNNSAYFSITQQQMNDIPRLSARTNEVTVVRFNDKRTYDGAAGRVIANYQGMNETDLIDIQHNYGYMRQAGGCQTVSMTAYFIGIPKILVANNVMDCVSESPFSIAADVSASSAASSTESVDNGGYPWMGGVRIGDYLLNCGEVIIENNTINITFEFSTDFSAVRFLAASLSIGIEHALIRNNLVFVEKTNAAGTLDRSAIAVMFGCSKGGLQDVKNVEIYNNTVLMQLVRSGAKCPIFSCTGLQLTLNGNVSNLDLINISSNNLKVLNTAGGGLGSAGVLLFVGDGTFPIPKTFTQDHFSCGHGIHYKNHDKRFFVALLLFDEEVKMQEFCFVFLLCW